VHKEIQIKDVVDFCWCPRYYDIKKEDPNEYNLKELYDISLHKVFYNYLYALRDGTLKDNMKFLKYQWGKQWVKTKTNSQLICTPSSYIRDTYDAKRKAGIDAIITFEELMNIPQFPIIINKPYAVDIGHNIILKGIWEYVREVTNSDGTKSIQVMKFNSENNRFAMVGQMNHDIELSAAAYAFKESFNVDQFELLYVDIYKKKVIASYRSEKDIQLLKDTVYGTVLCLHNNIRCVSPDKRCYHCEYRNVCHSKLG